MEYWFLLGRILYGGFFLISGISHFMKREMMTQAAASKGVPAPGAAVAGTGLLLLLGGLSIITGFQPYLGLACIVIFLVGVTPMMHAFWTLPDANQRLTEMSNFMRNMALLGAALTLLQIVRPWPLSLDSYSLVPPAL